MPNTKDIVLGGRGMYLFIGENGSGKTCAAASFPTPIKFFDFDGRMKPVKLMYPDKDVDYDTYGPNNFQSFKADLESLQNFCKFKTIVIDSITSLSVTLINYQLKFRSGEGGKKVAGGILVTGWDEINGETVVISQVLDVCKVLPCNVIFTAHPINRTEIIKGVSVRSRSIVAYGNKVSSIVPGYFDEVYSFQIEPPISTNDKAKRFILTQHIGEDFAKTALPVPNKIDFTDKSLYDEIQAAISNAGVSLETGGESDEAVKEKKSAASKLISF